MFLSRLSLNPRSRLVRRDLGDRNQLHRRVMSGFDDGLERGRAPLAVLFRVEPLQRGAPLLLVQAEVEPDWASLPSDYLVNSPATKAIGGALQALAPGRDLRFRLLANPTRKVARFDQDGKRRRQGTRVPLRGEEERIRWIVRKGEQHGFSLRQLDEGVPDLRAIEVGATVGRKPAHRIVSEGVLFEGRILVDDGGLLRDAVRGGIGPGKAYGYGLLSLAP